MKKRKVLTITIFVMVIIAFTVTSFAGDMTDGINITKSKTREFEKVGNTVLGIVRVAGILSSVGALMLLGIKYMLGSIEEKAEYKKTFPIYVLGCILVFCTATLAEVIYEWVDSLQI